MVTITSPSGPRNERGFFIDRHLGTTEAEQTKISESIGIGSAADLPPRSIPPEVRDATVLDLAPASSERALLGELRKIADENVVATSMIGLGYYDTILPAVLRRSVLESPAWYSAYTPYQAEISQGRLEALLLFQTMVTDLTALPVANASLLDEATAVVEAMIMCRRTGSESNRFIVDEECFPQTIAVLETRARPLGVELVVANLDGGLPAGDAFGVVVQYPSSSGRVRDLRPLIAEAHERGARAVVAADLLALMLFAPPGDCGADIAVGTSQRFGMPLGFGGPHAGYLAATDEFARSMPGRIVGVSRDALGNRALQLSLQTREQHIRREKATSNICTAEVLPAVVAAMFAVHHGPDGLRSIASRIHERASDLASELTRRGHTVLHRHFFDTISVRVTGRSDEIVASALSAGINLRRVDGDTVAVACDEVTDEGIIDAVVAAFGDGEGVRIATDGGSGMLIELLRSSPFLLHDTFQRYHSEAALARYLRGLSDRDLALDRTMIPLGSCTMKLNAAIEMEPISWPEFGSLHPFAPISQSLGIRRIISDLEGWLVDLTGFEAVSLQPNAGSQGELAGLLAIRAYHESQGAHQRDLCLVPASAHGTNPASAVLAGMRVVVVACDASGNVDLADLDRKLVEHRDEIAALMITYPSTSGIYEPKIREICDAVHEAGGQVYLDGANLNALIGVVRPGQIGADASHLNLHKTFCIPHGGGGPGVGPIAVKSHLAPFLPNHPLRGDAGPATGIGPLAGAPFGSAGILVIPWIYIRLMGGDGLKRATESAVLAANYLARELSPHFPVLYQDEFGSVAHECIIDVRPFTKTAGIRVDDVAKRLIDYGFHAPTMSFPVAGTLMIEPTESEGLAELDRLVEALASIRREIDDVGSGRMARDDNPLSSAPHTAEEVCGSWNHPYSRDLAAFPVQSLRATTGWVKYWPPVKRVDTAHGDRNLCCSLPEVTTYEEVSR
jgi:glycine dehydrogenase